MRGLGVENKRIVENSSAGYFGEDLDSEAPIIVCDCISFLRHRGLQEVGIFRIPGNADAVIAMKTEYNSHFQSKEMKESSERSILNKHNPPPVVSDVASLLKAFFKNLKTPLIPEPITAYLIEVVKSKKNPQAMAFELSKGVRMIPSPNRECLSFLISFLREITVFEKYNNMNPDNLATCFVLSVMGHGNMVDQLQVLGVGAVVIKFLIELPVQLFMPELRIVQNNTKFSNSVFENSVKLNELKRLMSSQNGKQKNSKNHAVLPRKSMQEVHQSRLGSRRPDKKKNKEPQYKKHGTRVVQRPILLADVVTGGKSMREKEFSLQNYEHADNEKVIDDPPPAYDPETMT